jgi:hypothetical protein
MIRVGSRHAALLILAAGMSAAPGSARLAEPPAVGQELAGSGTGLVCRWAIYASMLEVGRQCGINRDTAIEAEFARSVSAMEAYARRRSPEGAAMMDSYRARQIDRGRMLCHADALDMYRHIASVDPRDVRADTDRFLAASPPVEWGDCL